MSLCYLLAAGEGRRLRPYTQTTIKPRLKFLNLPLYLYGSYLALNSGFDRFLVNKHHLPEQVDQIVNDLSIFASKAESIDETQKLLGSGGALWNARNILSKEDHFMIANGDEVLLSKDSKVLDQLKQKFFGDQALATLLTCDHPELLKTLKAVWVNDQGEVKGFGMEAPKPGLKPVHYTGYKIFDRKILDWLPEGESNIFYDILVRAIAKGEKITHWHLEDAIWHETGNFESFLNASADITQCGWSFVQDRLAYFQYSENIKVQEPGKTLIYPKRLSPPTGLDFRGTVVLDGSPLPQGLKLENVIIQGSRTLQANKQYQNQMIF